MQESSREVEGQDEGRWEAQEPVGAELEGEEGDGDRGDDGADGEDGVII